MAASLLPGMILFLPDTIWHALHRHRQPGDLAEDTAMKLPHQSILLPARPAARPEYRGIRAIDGNVMAGSHIASTVYLIGHLIELHLDDLLFLSSAWSFPPIRKILVS